MRKIEAGVWVLKRKPNTTISQRLSYSQLPMDIDNKAAPNIAAL